MPWWRENGQFPSNVFNISPILICEQHVAGSLTWYTMPLWILLGSEVISVLTSVVGIPKAISPMCSSSFSSLVTKVVQVIPTSTKRGAIFSCLAEHTIRPEAKLKANMGNRLDWTACTKRLKVKFISVTQVTCKDSTSQAWQQFGVYKANCISATGSL